MSLSISLLLFLGSVQVASHITAVKCKSQKMQFAHAGLMAGPGQLLALASAVCTHAIAHGWQFKN
jgi:hypothetical protein